MINFEPIATSLVQGESPASDGNGAPAVVEEKPEFSGLRRLALKGVAWRQVHGGLGIYAQKVIGGDGAYEKRTERMEGWNECARDCSRRYECIRHWMDELPPEHKTLIEDLLLEKRLNLRVCGEKVMPWVDCSDVFFWGCADGEDIAFEELAQLAECCQLSPKHGGELWCCRKRAMRPQTACYRMIYQSNEWHLFDACGPERDDPDGKGRDALIP